LAAPDAPDLRACAEQFALRAGQTLEKHGLIERDIEDAWLAADSEAGPLDDLIGHSIAYRIAVGPRAGQKLFTLQTVPPTLPALEGNPDGAARAGGFSLHAGIDRETRPRLLVHAVERRTSGTVPGPRPW
jgi:hypothetical protein